MNTGEGWWWWGVEYDVQHHVLMYSTIWGIRWERVEWLFLHEVINQLGTYVVRIKSYLVPIITSKLLQSY